ncbi:zinc-dependent alcohol dehydrogenase family protein [Sphingomonas pseudosanguinis]|uniref:NADPH:quinone reductase-like Zn-dependent oxidoreductase n=1 Tax=Sphingomonas pseudosanguinis TaxID=413712 RepID=A0A7W6A9X4_9SPHN|nr:NAD(P)-dependent alcohol dehydrogenase [Sphingomonas pseudosanguinis]MBB3878589.1 NADPH:quinone reductase-like Zn-dependent oxidoreductase [Sphingomonas pseudosanguinis]MBN3536158.1 NAD(P)-dependent alcohol dehydrogenase [Sphingomonas pseudosanguinis]
MKAMILDAPGGLDRLRLVDRPDPGVPGPGMIRVRLHATSLNYHDYGIVSGNMPTQDGRVPMSDGAGIVEAIGEGVTDFDIGDAVVSCFFPEWHEGPARVGDFVTVPGDGVDGYAREAVIAPATAFTRTPKGYDHAEVATITTAGLTAWRSLVVDGGLKAGDRVLVLGTGGVSIWALQIAKLMGASVAVTSSSDAKLEQARALGADYTVNYREQEQWGRPVHDWADGGVDHVIEVGGPATLAQSIEAVRIGGHIGLIGVLTGVSGQVPTAALMAKQARLQGLIVGSRRMQRDFVRALDASDIRPVIDRRFALEELADAFRHQESGGHFGKIVATW